MPRIAPPPFGREMEGAAGFCSLSLRAFVVSGVAMGYLISFQRLAKQRVHLPLSAEQKGEGPGAANRHF